MGRSTDTNDIRTYCLNHMGGVFDHNYLSKNLFSNVPVANFRKYVTRLESDGLLRKVSKGLFLIGDSELSDRDRIIKHYIGDEAYAHGLIGGSALLRGLGFSDEPGRTTIYSNVAVGNKHLQDFEIDVVESHASYNRYFGGKDINTALELIYLKALIDGSKWLYYDKKTEKLLENYSDESLSLHVDFSLYSRQVFAGLANYLDMMHISNRVFEIYAYKTRNAVSTE